MSESDTRVFKPEHDVKHPAINTDTQTCIGGWQRLSRQTVYENPWIEVSHQNVRRPNGSEGIYGAVHFKSRALGIIAIDKEHHTWLVKQSRYVCDEFTYEIPEGGGPFNETALTAAKRELKEETGLSADHWQELMVLRTSNSVTDEKAHIFIATQLTQGEQALDESEDIEVIRLPLKEAINMALNGKITDAMSVAGLLKIAADPKFHFLLGGDAHA